jgi:molybdopterin converting factor small subunit
VGQLNWRRPVEPGHGSSARRAVCSGSQRGACVNVYADGVDVRSLEVERTPLRDGSVVLVLPSVAGG